MSEWSTTARRARIVEVMREISADCDRDAVALDSTAFTPRGVGERLGAMLAQIDALAKAVAVLAGEEAAC